MEIFHYATDTGTRVTTRGVHVQDIPAARKPVKNSGIQGREALQNPMSYPICVECTCGRAGLAVPKGVGGRIAVLGPVW